MKNLHFSNRLFLLGVCLLVLMGLSATMVLAAALGNGDFETGNLSSWTVVDTCAGAGIPQSKYAGTKNPPITSGSWFVYSGTSSPLSGHSVASPPQGTFAAISDQQGAGTHILYQDIPIPAGAKGALSFIIYYVDWSGIGQDRPLAFASPPTLDCTVSPNQQYRVDLVKPSAPIDSVAAGDVLRNLFQTQPGDPNPKGYAVIATDISAFAGQTIRLRFAEVDNQGYFNAAVDNVVIGSPADVPEADTLLLMGGGLGGLATFLGWQWRKVRKNK